MSANILTIIVTIKRAGFLETYCTFPPKRGDTGAQGVSCVLFGWFFVCVFVRWFFSVFWGFFSAHYQVLSERYWQFREYSVTFPSFPGKLRCGLRMISSIYMFMI